MSYAASAEAARSDPSFQDVNSDLECYRYTTPVVRLCSFDEVGLGQLLEGRFARFPVKWRFKRELRKVRHDIPKPISDGSLGVFSISFSGFYSSLPFQFRIFRVCDRAG